MTFRILVLFAALLLVQTTAAAQLSSTDRAEVLRNAAALLRDRYVDPAQGRRLADQLVRQDRHWSGIIDPERFASEVTTWLRRESGDGHLGLSYSAQPLSDARAEDNYNAAEIERWYGAQINHGVQRIERFDDNVMLIELRVFPPPAMAGDVIAAAMTVVAQADALIIDLRRNGGGAETANLITGYLLNEGGQALSGVYDRPTDRLQANTSPAWVPGRRFGGSKPLYVLTSRRTFSAAEALAYDLQALGRAVIVGEVTGGGAHPYAYRRVHMHFALDLPEGRSVNPITGGNWQGTGVRPDVVVPEDQALERALTLARARLAETRPGSRAR